MGFLHALSSRNDFNSEPSFFISNSFSSTWHLNDYVYVVEPFKLITIGIYDDCAIFVSYKLELSTSVLTDKLDIKLLHFGDVAAVRWHWQGQVTLTDGILYRALNV